MDEARKPSFAAFRSYRRPRRRAYGACYFGYALFVLPFIALQFWMPTAYERVHGISPTTVGVWLGLGYLVAGAPGTLLGGWLAEHLERRGHADGKLLVLLVAAIGAMPATVASQLVPDPMVGTGLVWLAMFFAAMALGPITAAIQSITAEEFRAQAAAVLYVLIFVVAFMGIPLAGLITDQILGDPNRLGQALGMLSVASCALAVLVVMRGRHAYLQLNPAPQTALTGGFAS